jgi:hypothetical protein
MQEAWLAFFKEALKEPLAMAVGDVKDNSSLLEAELAVFNAVEYFERVSFLVTHQ